MAVSQEFRTETRFLAFTVSGINALAMQTPLRNDLWIQEESPSR
ncbi:hypothetical protein [Phormidium pseudopriestleyi]|nr:hypothetical protein [Phormidium pseudopriestleyi]